MLQNIHQLPWCQSRDSFAPFWASLSTYFTDTLTTHTHSTRANSDAFSGRAIEMGIVDAAEVSISLYTQTQVNTRKFSAKVPNYEDLEVEFGEKVAQKSERALRKGKDEGKASDMLELAFRYVSP